MVPKVEKNYIKNTRKERVAEDPLVGDKVRNNLQGTRVVVGIEPDGVYYKVSLRSKLKSFCTFAEWKTFCYEPGGYVIKSANDE